MIIRTPTGDLGAAGTHRQARLHGDVAASGRETQLPRARGAETGPGTRDREPGRGTTPGHDRLVTSFALKVRRRRAGLRPGPGLRSARPCGGCQRSIIATAVRSVFRVKSSQVLSTTSTVMPNTGRGLLSLGRNRRPVCNTAAGIMMGADSECQCRQCQCPAGTQAGIMMQVHCAQNLPPGRPRTRAAFGGCDDNRNSHMRAGAPASAASGS